MSRKRGMARARGLAAELKELRDKSGLSTREAAVKVGVSSATINRIENAIRAVDPSEVSALLVAYGVAGNERVRIMELAREAEQRGRWLDSGSEYQGAPNQLTALMSFEAEATAITMMNPLVVPGMRILDRLEVPGDALLQGVLPGPVLLPRLYAFVREIGHRDGDDSRACERVSC